MKKPSQAELHAYVDQQLDTMRSQQIAQYLAENPEAAKKVEQYQKINQMLHGLYDNVLEQPIPKTYYQKPRYYKPFWLQAAAITTIVLFSGLLGFLSHDFIYKNQPITIVTQDLIQPATFAHHIYATEVKHPVEIEASYQEHLVNWLSKRLHAPIKAPNLAPAGFTLLGGRLLPSTNKMAAQLMYENSAGDRITLYIRRGAWQQTAFRYQEQEDMKVFYWIEGEMGYALVGKVDKQQLLQISYLVYDNLL